jgi:ATP-dependent Clp protease ATP-binding subunit ClpB
MFFMNEYQQAENARELPAMMKAHLNKGTRTFLFDEIEKAHRSVIDLFISLLDEGQITQIDGTRTNVGDTYLVMTSNIGAARWASMMATNYSRMEAFAYEQARRILRPELFNRLTETIVFRPLREDVQEAILAELVSKKLSYLHNRLGLRLSLDEQARTHLLRTCFTQTEGARRLRQELDRQINAAVLPYAIDRTQPVTEVIRYDPENDKLILV